jgi:hypothetical protein
MDRKLDVTVSAQFVDDGAGSTVARGITGPTVFGTSWELDTVSVSTTSTALLSSVFSLYVNTESPSGFRGGTYSGDRDTDTSPNISAGNLDRLIFVWTGGTLGTWATGTLTGTVKGR